MAIIKNFYNKILDFGQRSNFTVLKNKKIKLLNIYILVTIHFVFLMSVLDSLTGILNKDILLCYGCMFLSMLFLLFINKQGKVQMTSILLIVTILVSIFMFSEILLPESYNEYYYVFMPGIALTLYVENKISIAITAFSFFLFCIPYYISPVYPKEIIEKLDVFAVLGLFVCVYLLVNYFKKINIENELKLQEMYEKLEESKKNELASLQLKHLRDSVMNPHFMFNAMNSVQNLVIKGNTIETYNYLSKFSALVRGNLNMTKNNDVFLKDEFSLLKKQLEFEKLRFSNTLEYHLDIGKVNEMIKIPSMIIKPFLENTLLRVFHKVGGMKRIKIYFTQNKLFITCVIFDNGLSLEEANNTEDSDLLKVPSFSLESINEHISLLNNFYTIDIVFYYAFKNKETICTIKIPYKNLDKE